MFFPYSVTLGDVRNIRAGFIGMTWDAENLAIIERIIAAHLVGNDMIISGFPNRKPHAAGYDFTAALGSLESQELGPSGEFLSHIFIDR